MLPIASCVFASVLLSNPLLHGHRGVTLSQKPKHEHSGHQRARARAFDGTGPTLPFNVILAPGDSAIVAGTSYSNNNSWCQMLTLNDGDQVSSAASGSVGSTIIITNDRHTLALLPGTTVVVHKPDSGTGYKDTDCAYVTITSSSGGVTGTSGDMPTALLRARKVQHHHPLTGPNVKVVVKTSGSTTGVFGSSFTVRLSGTSTLVDLYSAWKVELGTAQGMYSKTVTEWEYPVDSMGNVGKGSAIPMPVPHLRNSGAKK